MTKPRRWTLHEVRQGAIACWPAGTPESAEYLATFGGPTVREDCITLSDRESAAKVISRVRDQEAWERLPQYVKDACRVEADAILSTIFKDEGTKPSTSNGKEAESGDAGMA